MIEKKMFELKKMPSCSTNVPNTKLENKLSDLKKSKAIATTFRRIENILFEANFISVKMLDEK